MKSLILLAGALLMGSCAMSAAGDAKEKSFNLTAPAGEENNDAMAYLINFDTNQKLDSAVISKGQIKIKGKVGEPVLARLIYNGKRGPVFVLEEGKITVDADNKVKGGALNAKMEAINLEMMKIVAQAQNLQQDSAGMARMNELVKQYNDIAWKGIRENGDNPVGLELFIDQASEDMPLSELNKYLAQYPYFAKSKKIQKISAVAQNLEETSVGHKYKNFEVTWDGKKQVFSDYLNKDGYTLVDFWASWCAPCIRATKTLKEILAKYGDKGLKVLGVAVWDEPEATLEAIKKHDLPWPSIINAQQIPTDIYGISGIPCIMLIGPDGTILSRGLQGQELIDAVAKAMDNAKKAE